MCFVRMAVLSLRRFFTVTLMGILLLFLYSYQIDLSLVLIVLNVDVLSFVDRQMFLHSRRNTVAAIAKIKNKDQL